MTREEHKKRMVERRALQRTRQPDEFIIVFVQQEGPQGEILSVPVQGNRYERFARNAYLPHQGKRECARRVR